MLFVKCAGISTANIINMENFEDILIEKNLYLIGKNSKDRDAVKYVLKETDAMHIPTIIVGGTYKGMDSARSFSHALKMVKEESVILCIQDGTDGGLDAAALVVTPDIPQNALAIIENEIEQWQGKQARILEVYQKGGPVSDALSAIECCIAINYGFDFNQNWAGEMFLEHNYAKDIPIKCQFSDCIIQFKQAKGVKMVNNKIHKFIIPLTFETELQLLDELQELKISNKEIIELSKECMYKLVSSGGNERVVVFLVSNKEELQNEIVLFSKERDNWCEEKFIWKSKLGSLYFANPLGKNAKICYVNPPGGMFSKVQFYRLYRSIPTLKRIISKNRITQESKLELISRYYFEIMTIMLTVKALEQIGIMPNAIVGGSLGELSIPLIMDVTTVGEQVYKAEDCPLGIMYEVIKLLEEVIDGQRELSYKYFGTQIEEMEKWYLVCDYRLIQKEIQKLPEKTALFTIIIGSPKDVIICGTHKLCMDLIEKLHCYSSQLKDPIYAHTPVLEPFHKIMRERMESLQVHLADGLPFDIYRTYKKEKLGNSVEEFAENYADCLIKQVNMPDIFKQAYEDGCRIFIDLGSNSFCSRWAKETFHDKRDTFVHSLYDKSIPSEAILSIIAILIANKANLIYDKFLEWYLSFEKEREEVDSMNENRNNAWKKEFMEKLIINQMKRNDLLYQHYFDLEKKIVSKVHQDGKHEIEKYSVKNSKLDNRERAAGCLYNYEQILEMTDGSMANVLGEKYKEVDKYEVRARMPLPPYLFASRITKIDAKYGEIKTGSSIEAEYDIPYDSLMKVNQKTVSSVVFSEAAHIGIFLTGYMGIDVYSSGNAKFRITDVTTKYVSGKWPCIGDTIQMKFTIDRLIKNGDTILLICSYKVYLDHELIIDAKETGGFFTQQMLNRGSGINGGTLKQVTKNDESLTIHNLYAPVTTRRSFSKKDVHKFFGGDYKACFGSDIVNCATPYEVCEEAMFVDEIIELSENGGKYGLGYIVAKKEIDSTYWPFKCHFKNDPVLPGTIMLEGISQSSTFFQTYMGLYDTNEPFVTKMLTGYEIQTKFRGEVKCGSHTIIYRVDAKDVKKVNDGILFVADGEVYCDEIQVIEQKNAAIIISENF